MERTNAPRKGSPWPACADCQVEDTAADDSRSEAPRSQQASHEPDDDALFGDIEPSAELGPLRETVRQQTLAALRRALARAREAEA